ncbi:MAG: NAD-dependent epimerase/dehydratase family protein [Actinobacteria bacterium]|nr:NAD-dependent epimerase/dehydratase family protein [Actinomycetota bacterium]
MQNHHVVVGAGPTGSAVARLLAERGTAVTVVTRRGSGPEHPQISRQPADATDAARLRELTAGATAIYNCANPPYTRWPTAWPPIHRALMAVAENTGAVLVMMDNLYAFGAAASMPMREGDEMQATGRKGAVRAMMARELLAAHANGRLRATLARASDFYGPGVRDAAFGERVLPRVLAGKKVSLLGDLDVPHSTTYVPDVARTLVAIAEDERAWGLPWHVPNAPARTQRQLVEALANAAGTSVQVAAVPRAAITMLGMVVPLMRELRETWYQFELPWVSDSTLTEATFGLNATPVDEAAAATVDWWRQQSS